MSNFKNYTRAHWMFIVGLILTLMVLWPLLVSPYFSHHDNLQVIRLYEMDKCFRDFQIPCRWVPDLGGLYGYPLFNYYAPLAYYYGEFIYFLTGSLIISVKIMFASAFVASYIFMYLAGRKLWGEAGAVISAIFYTYAPYHAVLLFVRGAMGELWGVTFFPAIIWAILRLKESSNVKNVLVLGFFIGCLILSHNLSTLIFLPNAVLFSLIIPFSEKTSLQNILKSQYLRCLTLSFALGLLLSTFYWMPAVFEKKLVHVDSTISGYFYYTEHFKGFKKLVLDNSWGWGGSVREVPGGEKDGMSFQIGWVHLAAWMIVLFGTFKAWKKERYVRLIVLISSFVALFSIFMVNPRSEFVWKLMDPLKYLQFPWRFLGIIIFFISLIAGGILTVLPKKYGGKIGIVLVILVVLLNFGYFRPEQFLQTKDQDFLTGEYWVSQLRRSIFDFLPIYADEPPGDIARSRYEIITGEADVKNYSEGTNWFNFDVDVKSHSIIRVSQFYFPNWIILDNGEKMNFSFENNLGLMTIILGEGTHAIEGRMMDTTVRLLGNWISLFSFIIFLILTLLQFSKVRKWILYYLRGIS